MANVVQINCPFCNAAQAMQADGNYSCEFCLQPFSVVQAQAEESRLLTEIKAWVQDKVGVLGVSSSVDASSRAFIFQQRILPELQRDIDRSIEAVGGHAEVPLVCPPTPERSTGRANPLITQRPRILGLKDLRARLSSHQVREFALADADRAQVGEMDRRLGQVMHMANVADAAARRDGVGYVTARRNLDALSLDTAAALSGATGQQAVFLSALQNRYRALAEICELYGRVSEPAGISSVSDADTLQRLADALVEAADAIEKSEYSPVDAMPFVMAIRDEAAGCQLTKRWLQSHAAISGDVPFMTFVTLIQQVLSQTGVKKAGIDLLEVLSQVIGAVRRETTIGVVANRAWIAPWTEQTRAKKTFGLLGNEEEVAGVREFYLPVWCAELTYSKAAGAVFKSGVEQHSLLAAPACSPKASDVLFADDRDHPIAHALAYPGLLDTTAVALPTVTWEDARRVFVEALGRRPDVMNPKLQPKGLVFVPAATATFRSKKGQRDAGAWLDGTLALDSAAVGGAGLVNTLIDRLGSLQSF
jgi:hypothetical protein